MSSEQIGGPPFEREEDESRREFLKIAAAISGALALAGIASVMKSVVIPAVPGASSTPTEFPRVKVSSVSELSTGTAVIFNYPLSNEPNILVKLGQKAEGGVGPDGDIVAFSQICQHLGCIWGFVAQGKSPTVNPSFVAPGPVGYCPCHGSVYDLLEAGKVIGGPAPRPAPQVQLQVDSAGDVYAAGMGPPTIFGHDTGSANVSDDLQGGTLVTSA
ncbi:MAG: arsenate reductase (azurin) small subunit [Nitrososphaerota archaeon]|nr:arsenate reductase (azurin) small subunit [Nitrososphaerota archaeon]MDG6987308.1 arsenate reductase (azurin) small subunit [Nitrososphaerota archaeon]MDG7015408.1 arsenate reductase (azurin) small subunit [Nitrososphaerota archaeon]WGO50153.1 MAG: arsenate reductase (azurin) small subunit [Nitrososphaerota archaeon]